MVMPIEAAAKPFGTTWLFGDSLTDSGTFKSFLPPGTGKFTTNPGPVWSEVFARTLGSSGEPANSPGATYFAQGGARVTQRPGVTDDNPLTASALPVHDQISAYLGQSRGAADRGAIYTVWAGDNNIFPGD